MKIILTGILLIACALGCSLGGDVDDDTATTENGLSCAYDGGIYCCADSPFHSCCVGPGGAHCYGG